MRRMISLAMVVFFVNSAFAQDSLKYELDQITVTASNIPMILSQASRTVWITGVNEIKNIPVESFSDVLRTVSGFDVRNRGTDDIQEDISMRGGTFEQTLVMIDGIPVNDPQTGHHTMSLPLELNDVQRVEVLKGQGSKSFGANAFSGVVNFITKTLGDDAINMAIYGGEYGYYKALLSGAFNSGGIYHRIGYSKTSSDGFISNTNFTKHLFSYSQSINSNDFIVKNRLSYNDKKFGANSFYSIRFPKQAEHTKTLLGSTSILTKINKSSVQVSAYYRRNRDEFMLDYTNPGFYKNTHITQTIGLKTNVNIVSPLGRTAIGGEYKFDKIESNNLGNHSRESGGIFVEHLISAFRRININIGGFVYNYSGIGWKFWPGAEIGYSFNDKLNVYASIGKAFRTPTFTELYYEDPVTKGNSNLFSEETVNTEVGLKYQSKTAQASIAFFNNNGKNIIDWVKLNPGDKWQARNMAKLNTSGIEVNLSFRTRDLIPLLNNVALSYSYINAGKNANEFMSKYALEYLRHQVIFEVSHKFIFNSDINWLISYSDRNNMDDLFLTGLKAKKKFKNFIWTLTVKNLFNKNYKDFLGVQLPGRWIRSGIELELK